MSKSAASPLVYFFSRQLGYVSCLLFLLFPLSALVSCGTPPDPTSFIFADADHLSFLSWNVNDDGTLSGQYTINVEAPYSINVLPYKFIGTRNGQQVKLVIQNFFTGPLLGQLKDNTLQFAATDSNGHAVKDIGYSGSQDDYDKLLVAFKAHALVRGAIDTLNTDVMPRPSTAKIKDTVAAKKIRISQEIKNVQTFWSKAQGISIPQVSGLTLPWVISKDEVSKSIDAGQQFLNTAPASS